MAADGGAATLLVPAVRAAENVNWRVTPNGIYYVGMTADQVVVQRAPLDGGPAIDVAWIGNYSWPGFAVTRDGSVIYAHWDRREATSWPWSRDRASAPCTVSVLFSCLNIHHSAILRFCFEASSNLIRR